jgi:hypothetical protein
MNPKKDSQVKIIQINEQVVKNQIGEVVRESVEETLNGLWEADALCRAQRYKRSEEHRGRVVVPFIGRDLLSEHL